MKKMRIVSSASFGMLTVASVTAYFLRYASERRIWVHLTVGALLLVLSAILALLAGKRIWACVVLCVNNAIALGFLLRAWYIFRGFDNSLLLMLGVSAAAVAYLWIFFLISRVPPLRRRPRLFTLTFVVISAVAYTVLVFTTRTTFLSTFGFYMLLELSFVFAMCKSTAEPAELVRAILLSTYSLIAVAAIIAIAAALGDADIDLDFDFSLDGADGVELGAEIVGDFASAPSRKRVERTRF